jgi:thiol-disulfide isomerase/thioredoxin
VRTDENVSRRSFRHSKQWETDANSGELTPDIDRRLAGVTRVDGQLQVHSLSGNERNHLFLSSRGKEFTDLSAISGLDTPADSRGFVLWDYDHDGWQDIALVNANDPLLNLYHNELGRMLAAEGSMQQRMMAIRFVGANRSARPSSKSACRDGYGALAAVSLGDLTIQREHRCGEGYATQNSATMIVGLGHRDTVDSVAVSWPSGMSHKIENVSADTLLIAYEDPSDSPSGSPFESRSYRQSSDDEQKHLAGLSASNSGHVLDLTGLKSAPPATNSQARLKVYTTMATWCVACKKHIPQLAYLRSQFDEDVIELIGVPADENDTTEMLTNYSDRWHPPYRLILDLTAEQRSKVSRIITETTKTDAQPSTIITDGSGNVLEAIAGVPTVSSLQKLLADAVRDSSLP